VKKLTIGSFRQEACAGAPAPPRWNARTARVFGRGFRTVMEQDRPDSIFSQLQGKGKWGLKRVPERSRATPCVQQPDLWVKISQFVGKGEWPQGERLVHEG
jgi:hypothetical protein